MAQINALEAIEKLTRQTADFPFDGYIVEVFPESVNVKLIGSETIKRNVPIPDHIPFTNIRKGVPVKLGDHLGQPMLLAIFPQLQNDLNYAGRGSVIPDPPAISVIAAKDGWLVSWAAVPGADRYRVYRNDTADETSPDDLGYTGQLSMLVPYESPYVYFAVRSISGLNESELSGWLTDNTAPPVPTSFDVEDDIQGHRLLISVLDASLNDPGFKCWEVQQANDASGTNTIDLGQMGLSDFPRLMQFPQGTTRYYRARALDMAGNASSWTAWQLGFAIITGIGQTIQDKFDGYGGAIPSRLENLWWLKIAQFAPEEGWGGNGSYNSTILLEGNTARDTGKHQAGGYLVYDSSNNLMSDLDVEGRFTDDDYIILSVYRPTPFTGGSSFSIIFAESLYHAGNPGSQKFTYSTTVVTGWNYLKIKKSEFTAENSPDWANVRIMAIQQPNVPESSSTSGGWIIDDLRIVKADPDNANTYNDTGPAWDRATNIGTDVGEWHIYKGNRAGEPAKPFSYGQIKTATSPALWYFSHKPLVTTNIISGTIQAGVYLKGANGQAGLAFFVKNVIAGSWDMYTLEADSAADAIQLVKWVGGTRTVISTASFTFGPNQILWFGADFRDYDADGGRIRVYASLSEGNLIQASRMVISAQDTQWLGDAGGSVGLLSYQANVRFVNLVAGSPAHSDVADVAYALDGPIVGGETRRVSYNRNNNYFEYSDDDVTTPVGIADETAKVSKLYESDFGAPALNANADGYLSAAVQPMFRASNTITRTDVTGDGTIYQLIFNNEIFDRNNNYNNSTGVFTAPVTGKYLFMWSFLLTGIISSHTTAWTRLTTTSHTQYSDLRHAYNSATGAGELLLQGSTIIDMTGGDTAKVEIRVAGGTKVVDIYSGTEYSHFCGYLLP
jgi:hypothetical protein